MKMRPYRRTLVLLLALASCLIVASPLSAARTVQDGSDGVTSIQAPAGFPSLDSRFEPSKGKNPYRGYYSYSKARTWDAWSGHLQAKGAIEDARLMLKQSDTYTHAFVVEVRTGKIVWASWTR